LPKTSGKVLVRPFCCHKRRNAPAKGSGYCGIG
jgi:hypothetical protein